MPILRSTLALPVDVPPVCSLVMSYFASNLTKALLPKSPRPPSCRTVLTANVRCCLATSRSHDSKHLALSDVVVMKYTHVKLVRLQMMYNGIQYPSADCTFCLPPLSIDIFCMNFAGSDVEDSVSLCLAPFLFLASRQQLHTGIRSMCLASSRSLLI